MMISKGRCDIAIKINEVPQAYVNGKNMDMQFDVGEGLIIDVTIKGKSWRKFLKGVDEFPEWAGIISGRLGPKTLKGFRLLDAGIQIFEKKPKPAGTAEEEQVS